MKPVGGVAVAVALAAASYYGFSLWAERNAFPEGLVQANGRIEGDHITVASKFPGRIEKLLAREGDTVARGQVLVELDDDQVRAKVTQARKAVAALEARLQAAHATEAQASRDAQRLRALAETGTVDPQQKERADTAWTVASNNVSALEAQHEQAKAALAEAESVLNDLTIVAPAGGIITTRLVDVGEVVGAGAPLLDIVDMDRLYLEVYVPEVEIGKLRRGLPARIYTDAFPDRSFRATLRYIASRAEFTPKEVQTTDERVRLVYAVKLYLDENPEHRLTPGLPADAVIRWKEDTQWVKPRW